MSRRISSLRVTYEEEYGGGRPAGQLTNSVAIPGEDGAVVPDNAAQLPNDIAGEMDGFSNSYGTLPHSNLPLSLARTCSAGCSQQRLVHPSLPPPPPPLLPPPLDTNYSVTAQFSNHLYGTQL